MKAEKEKATEAANDNQCKDTSFSNSYLKTRLDFLNISEDDNRFSGVLDAEGIHSISDFHFFTSDDNDNILIHYLTPENRILQYPDETKNEGRNIRDFVRTRLKNPKDPKHKYDQPRGTETYPFLTPEVLRAYRDKVKIKTLYITEGEFKAFKLSMYGVPCIGLGGIQNFKNSQKDKLHPDILEVMNICEVENILLLFDRDCVEIKWEDGKDLAARPNNFYSALNTFDQLTKNHVQSLYFSHISLKCREKGIDDLLCVLSDDDQDICIKELTSLAEGNNSRHFIETQLITGRSSKIKAIFGLDSVQHFYDQYKNEIGDHDFYYFGTQYHFENEKVVLSWGGLENNYILVGNDYYQRVVDKSAHGDEEINLYRRDKGIIISRYGKSFIKAIQIYDGFANIPENDPDKYKKTIISEKEGVKSVLYNIYRPLEWKPVKGKWDTIESFLHHIFDYPNIQGTPLYDLAIDWLQIVYTNPTQQLPCICLVSKERKTGKTTFLDFLHLVFSENFRVLDSERIGNKFNESWAGKLVIGVDESLIDPENKGTVANTLKTLITNKTINSEGKGTANKPIANYAKLIMCSNDETNFIRIEAEENRYMVVKVPPLKQEDPDIILKIKSEIPAFLFYLKNRDIKHPKQSRLWFDEELFKTEALSLIQECTENLLIRNVKDCVRKQFFIQKTNEIRLSLSVIYTLVKEQYKHSDKTKISDYLRSRGLKAKPASNFTYYYSYEAEISVKDRYYIFKVSEWLTTEEIEELKINE